MGDQGVDEGLERALAWSRFTDPGRHRPLFEGLATTLEHVVALVKAQLVHPVDARFLSRAQTNVALRTARATLTVEQLVDALQARAPGLGLDRRPDQRLVVPCDHHALLAAAVLKAGGVPCRMRAGFATYLVPGRPIAHVVCEVWDGRRWQGFDPERGHLAVGDGFSTGAQAWQAARGGDLDVRQLHDWRYRGVAAARLKLFVDANAVMNQEMVHYEWLAPGGRAPRLLRTPPAQLRPDDLAFLDDIAGALSSDALETATYDRLCR